jgi:hypothetical protein
LEKILFTPTLATANQLMAYGKLSVSLDPIGSEHLKDKNVFNLKYIQFKIV